MTVMMISGVLLLTATAMIVLASNASFRMRRLAVDSRALHVAEAGIADMIGKMTEDYWYWQSNINELAFTDGSFTVVSQVQIGGNVLLISTGTVGTVSRVTSVELLGNDRARNDSFFSVDGAILSGGDVRFRTSDFRIRGNVHSNQDITSESGADQGTFEPSSGLSNVYITAVGTVGDLQGELHGGVPPRELPEFDFDSYRQLAIEDGLYLDGNQTIRHWGALPANGIVYVNGDLTLGGDSHFSGTLVVNGNINFRNEVNSASLSPDMPAILCTGSISLGNKGSVAGLIYAGINVYIQNHVVIDGGIISVGYTEINNRTEVDHSTEPPVWDPLQPDVPPEVIVGGWLR